MAEPTSHLAATVGAFWVCVSCLGAAPRPAQTAGKVFHVSIAGSDRSAGTAEAPWRTIQRAADTMGPGDTCVVRRGTYRERVRPANSGRAGRPIRFVAAAGEDVLVTGTQPVTDWSTHEKGVFKAPVKWPVEQVFVGGRLMVPARTPNAWPSPWKLNLLKVAAEGSTCRIEGLNGENDLWKGGFLWGMNARAWVAQTVAVAGSSAGTVTLERRSPFGRKGKGSGRAYLFGALGALDAEREWHQQDGRLYLMPPAGRADWRRRVEVTRRRWAFDLSGRSHVEVRGVRLFAASINMDGAERCVVDGIRVRYASFQRVMRGGFNRDRGIGADSEGTGIVLGGRGNIVRNSVIAYCIGDGISIYGEGNRVDNCVIHDCNTSGSDCAPITCTGSGHAIVQCTLFNAGRSLLVHRKLRRGRIEHNHMFRAGLITNDLGATYTFQTDGEGTVIAYNRVHDVHCHTGVGIYVDNMSPNHVVHHNLCTACDDCGIRLNTPTRNVGIYHNTLTGNGKSIDRWGARGNVDQPGCIVANNIMTDPGKLGKGAASNHNFLKGDPKFVNAEEGDFRLRADSPCIDAGTVIEAITGRYEGDAPDIGCYERGRDPWRAGSTLPRKLWDETGW